MPFITTEIPGLMVFEPTLFEDSRGYFFEAYNENTFHGHGADQRFVQDNQSSSSYGVIRGLHYQLPPYAQSKLVRVLSGIILDAVVDLRKGSPSFGKSFSIELSAGNNLQLLVPRGFAHGFSVLSDRAIVLYKCDNLYNKASDAGIRYDDPELKIDWRVPADKAIVSEKDGQLPLFADCRNEFVYEK